MKRWAGCLALAGGAAAAAGGLAGAGLLVSRGRLHLDIGWGRSVCPLGPTTMFIDAPRELVYQLVSAPYLGTMPSALADKIRIVERHGNLVIAEHRTKLPGLDAITVESVLFEPPGRVSFRLLRGPVPQVSEEFLLADEGSGTRFTYQGELGTDLGRLGRFYGERLVKPKWEQVVADSLEQVKAAAEQRAEARRAREARHPNA